MIKRISVIDIKEIIEQGSGFCKKAREVVCSSESLFLEFTECKNQTVLTVASKRKIYDDLLKKSFNARMGAEKKRLVQEKMGHCTSAATVSLRESLQVFNKKLSIESASEFTTKAVIIKKEQMLME